MHPTADFGPNSVGGRDLVAGNVRGCIATLEAALDELRFSRSHIHSSASIVRSLLAQDGDPMQDRPPLLNTHPHLKEFMPFLDDLNKESARGAVLIAVSYLEGQLKRIIAAYLSHGEAAESLLDDFNGPLGTFAARSHAAAALGLITDREYQELKRLGKLRNRFAHNHRTTFSDRTIIDWCGNLTFSAKDYDDVVVDARGQFISAAVALILNLTNRPHYVAKKRPAFEAWPY